MTEPKRYKTTYLSTTRSRKMSTFFVQTGKDKGAVVEAREKIGYPISGG